MKRFRRKGNKQDVIISLRRCITPKCKNPTPSFYCDECWDRYQMARRTA